MFNGLECFKILGICALVSAHEKLDIWTWPNSDDCSCLFLKVKLYFYQEKTSLTQKVGLGKESSNKNID